MITCPNCQFQELPGALFCSECGAQLVKAEAMTTQNLTQVQDDLVSTNFVKTIIENEKPVAAPTLAGENAVVSLYLIDADKTIQLSGRSEYSIGRVAEGQPILPDVDTSQYDAYAQGVSRLHASLKVTPQRITIMDLGSSNGTRVNGQKIVPHVDFPITHGDVVALGKLKIQIIIQYSQ